MSISQANSSLFIVGVTLIGISLRKQARDFIKYHITYVFQQYYITTLYPNNS